MESGENWGQRRGADGKPKGNGKGKARVRGDESTLGEFAITAAEPAFVTNHLNRLLFMNRSAADLLGLDGADTLGLPCWRLFGGTDLAGNRFCRPNCPLLRAALRGETLPSFPAKFRGAGGQNICVSVSTLLFSGASGRDLAIVHLLGPNRCSGDRAETADAIDSDDVAPLLPSWPEPWMLTRREIEILRLMGEGVGSDQIARRLFISVLTVRTHIQRILPKLGAHSKLQAAAVARRLNLL